MGKGRAGLARWRRSTPAECWYVGQSPGPPDHHRRRRRGRLTPWPATGDRDRGCPCGGSKNTNAVANGEPPDVCLTGRSGSRRAAVAYREVAGAADSVDGNDRTPDSWSCKSGKPHVCCPVVQSCRVGLPSLECGRITGCAPRARGDRGCSFAGKRREHGSVNCGRARYHRRFGRRARARLGATKGRCGATRRGPLGGAVTVCRPPRRANRTAIWHSRAW